MNLTQLMEEMINYIGNNWIERRRFWSSNVDGCTSQIKEGQRSSFSSSISILTMLRQNASVRANFWKVTLWVEISFFKKGREVHGLTPLLQILFISRSTYSSKNKGGGNLSVAGEAAHSICQICYDMKGQVVSPFTMIDKFESFQKKYLKWILSKEENPTLMRFI